ncbi:hypothetical protein DAI43_11980, partial [Achromobacter xylosoxidans]
MRRRPAWRMRAGGYRRWSWLNASPNASCVWARAMRSGSDAWRPSRPSPRKRSRRWRSAGSRLSDLIPRIDSRQRTEQSGVYAQDQISYGNWLLTLGGRYDMA